MRLNGGAHCLPGMLNTTLLQMVLGCHAQVYTCVR